MGDSFVWTKFKYDVNCANKVSIGCINDKYDMGCIVPTTCAVQFQTATEFTNTLITRAFHHFIHKHMSFHLHQVLFPFATSNIPKMIYSTHNSGKKIAATVTATTIIY